MEILNQVPEDVISLIDRGLAKVYGGVVRRINTPGKNGQIVRILDFAVNNNENDMKNIMNEISKLDSRFKNQEKILSLLSNSQDLLKVLSQANLIVSGLNLCVTAAGFALVLNKLKKIDNKLEKLIANTNSIDQKLDDFRAMDILKKILKLINFASVKLQRFQLFKEEKFNSDNFDSVLHLIVEIRIELLSLINSKPLIPFEYILMLYNSYISLNKLIISQLYSINKLNGYNELEHLKTVNDLIKNSVLHNYIYNTMFLSSDNIYLESEIQECVLYFKDLFDYNFEYIDSQHKLLLNSPIDEFQII